MEWRRGCGLPSPAAIRKACERIQAGWTESERQKRRVGPDTAAETPVIKLEDLAATH
jgi:hypothetical protein